MGEVVIKAAVCREFGAPLSVEELSLSPPGAEEARVKIFACAVCHSDLIYMRGGWGGTPPIVFGHEAAGIVAEAGERSGVAVGDKVLATLLRSCGGCIACQRGLPALCEGEMESRPKLRDGSGAPVAAGLKTAAFAEQAVVHRSQLAPIPKSLPFDEASLLSCGVLTGWGAATHTAKVAAGESVAVVGCGGVGLNCLQGAAAAGAHPIVALDVAEEKLKLADVFGATHAVDARGEGATEKARAIVGGRGFEHVFMAAGSGAAVEQAAKLTASMGALILVGMPADGDLAKLDAATIASRHQRILGSKMGGARLSEDIPMLIQMHAMGRLKLRELIGDRWPFADINSAIAAAQQGGALRNVLLFDH